MLNMFVVESLVCQLVSWPFAINGCAWQQWIPALAGFLSALAIRIAGIGRLITFLAGVGAFYLPAIALALASPPLTDSEQTSWLLMGCLFLFPVVSVVSLSGLLCGDLFRIFRKRARENSA
ncbi:MAG: hypothetical protein QM739_17495 [Propionivibrio sp.]